MSEHNEQTVLLADIGGTHIRFALYDGHEMGQIGIFRHEGEDSFDTAYRAFLSSDLPRPASMIIGAAGVVQDGQVRFSNRPLSLSETGLKERYELAFCRIVNDFELQAYATTALEKGDCFMLNKGVFDPQGTRCIIGPGTGLGVCFLTCDGIRLTAHPSEAGHATLPILSQDLEINTQITHYLISRFKRVSVERLLSGQGLLNIASALNNGQQIFDTPEAVFSGAVQGNLLARQVFDVFFKYLGIFCADMALTMKTTGGIYLTGDLLRQKQMIDWMQHSEFMNYFKNVGRFKDFTYNIPVHLVQVPQTAFLGLKYLADHIIF